MNMSTGENLKNRVRAARVARGWSQDELARRSGLSRSGVSAIEIERLVPSAAAALALARALECRVEDLFSLLETADSSPSWFMPPASAPCRYWQAEVGGRALLIPGHSVGEAVLPHDGYFDGTSLHALPQGDPRQTLVMACCDPAVGLLAHELARRFQIRLLVIPRSSRQALELLRNRQVHVAGLHLSRASEDGNSVAVQQMMTGAGNFSLLRMARWEEGVALAPGRSAGSIEAVVRGRLRWIGREAGSGAQQCLDEMRGDRPRPRHYATSHRGVAETIRAGMADAGICLRLVSEQAGLDFLPVREEAYDLCCATDDLDDPRIRALVEVIRSSDFRKLLGELPGYSTEGSGTVSSLPGPSTATDA